MPVTLPAHAAAVLPLFRWLPPSALVVGACAPDLVYLIGTYGWQSHRPLGLVTHCLPLGLAAYVALEVVVLPMLRARLWPLFGIDLRRFLATAGLARDARGWLKVMGGIL